MGKTTARDPLPGGDSREALAGAGEMEALVESFDWSKTAIGPRESWSPTLNAVVRLVLSNRFPLLLWWGPKFCQIYNNPYRPVLGTKHPKSLGQPASECWSEIWSVIGPLIETPFHGGPATWVEDLELQLQRYDFTEETHFTVAYSPVPDEAAPGKIGGVLATVHEISAKVIGDRRVVVLRDLGARSAEAKTAEEACKIAAETFSHHTRDLPFALLYLLDDTGRRARLAGSSGVAAGANIGPDVIELESNGSWPLLEAARTESIVMIDGLADRFAAVPPGPWPEPPRSAAVVPIPSNIPHRLAGFLVLGVSSHIAFDDRYRSFFELVAGQVATAIANATAYERERKRAEALAELDRAKTAFFSNVSHEFRTPLTLALGPLQELLSAPEGAFDHGSRELLQIAHRNGLRLEKLVNSLLDFVRIEAGRVQASYEPVDLSALTADLASSFRSAVEASGVRLVVDCPPLAEPVYVDREMWEKIVLNFLSNAFKFTLEGTISVSLRQSGNAVEMTVADTGIGIPEHAVPHVFERFYRVEGARGRSAEGTGIGLALVSELVKLHGGSIRVETAPGKGSAFTVTMPLGCSHLPEEMVRALTTLASTALHPEVYVGEVLRRLPATDADARAVLDSGVPDRPVAFPWRSRPARRARILLADDNADMRDYIRRLLAGEYDVEAVANGREALRRILESPPDLVLSDVMMPELNGFQLLEALRADAGTNTLPFILLSARAGEESRAEGLEHGADDYIIKPFNARELLARVGAHLELSRVRQQAMNDMRGAQEIIAATKDRLERVLGFITEGYYVLDSEWRFVEMNARAEQHFRRPAAELLGENLWKATGVPAGSLVYDKFHEAEAGEHPVHFEAESRVSPGYWADLHLYPRGGGLEVYFHDITERKRAEEALRESEERFRALVTASSDAVFRMNPDWSEMRQLRGRDFIPDTKAPSRTWLQKYIYPDDRPRVLAAVDKAIRTRSIFELEHRVLRVDGSLGWTFSRAIPLRNANGEIVEWLGAASDITERKRAEEALRESEAVLRSFFDSPGVMRGIVELVDGDIVHISCNAAAAEMTGVDRDPISGKPAKGMNTPEELARRWAGVFEESRRTGKPVTLEYARRNARGQECRLLTTGSYIGNGPTGSPRFGYTAIDVTERKRAEEALFESEERFRTMADSCPAIIWVTDAEARNRFVNREYREFFGVTSEEAEGTNWQPLVHPDDAPAYLAEVAQAFGERTSFRAEARVRRADGEWRWIASYGKPRFSASGEFLAYAGISLDITDRKAAAAEVEQLQKIVSAAQIAARFGVFRWDAKTGQSRWSPETFNLHGLDPSTTEPSFDSWFQTIHADDRDRILREVRQTLSSADGRLNIEYRSADGLRWIGGGGQLYRDSDGQPDYMVGINIDITERKQAEERYRTLFDTLIEGFCVIEVIFDADGRPADYRFLEINPAFEAQTGLVNAQGRLMRELAPEHEAHWFEIYGRVAMTGQPARFVNEAKALNRWYDVSAYRVGGPESRKVAILFNDITEARRAAEALRESEERLRITLESAGLGTWILNPVTGEFAASTTARKIHGIAADAPLDYRIAADAVHPEDRNRFESSLRQALEEGIPFDCQHRVLWPDGTVRWVHSQGRYLDDPAAGSKRMFGIVEDVTERRKAEDRLRQAQKLESLGLLAGGVAHDFNNLLVGVIGYASLAQDMLPLEHPAAELLDRVLKTGEQAAHLTRQMLAYSGKGKFVVEPLNLSAVIPEMIGLVRPSISKKITLHLDLEEDLPAIEADLGQVQQVFMNLTLNAAEAIGSREGLITVRTGVEEVDVAYMRLHPETATLAPGKYVCLEVRDTGCGMDEATRAKIFDPFFSTKFVGRGLGLAAVDGVLRGHKGAIAVTSAPGKGSCFTVLFPASARTTGTGAARADAPAIQGAGTVLVVDDEPIVREMAKRALERHGYAVLSAQRGSEAVDIFKRHPGEIALVVLDLSMPQMSGEETLRELRKIRPEVKVMVSSGYSESEALALFEGQRVSGFIQKPYSASGIAEKVASALK